MWYFYIFLALSLVLTKQRRIDMFLVLSHFEDETLIEEISFKESLGTHYTRLVKTAQDQLRPD